MPSPVSLTRNDTSPSRSRAAAAREAAPGRRAPHGVRDEVVEHLREARAVDGDWRQAVRHVEDDFPTTAAAARSRPAPAAARRSLGRGDGFAVQRQVAGLGAGDGREVVGEPGRPAPRRRRTASASSSSGCTLSSIASRYLAIVATAANCASVGEQPRAQPVGLVQPGRHRAERTGRGRRTPSRALAWGRVSRTRRHHPRRGGRDGGERPADARVIPRRRPPTRRARAPGRARATTCRRPGRLARVQDRGVVVAYAGTWVMRWWNRPA